MRHIILISGKDSLATAIVQIAREPDLDYEFVFNETGWDLPETLEWIDRVEARLGRKVRRLGDNLTEICLEENCLPLPFRRFCTRLAKIQPLNDYLGVSPATVYFGLRFDEPERIGYVASPGQQLVPKYPLRELRLGLSGVWRICESVNLLPPAFRWKWMENRVRHKLGSDAWLLDQLPTWQKNSLLAWRSRSNCDRCFYARQYEKIGLYEQHPDRFFDACELEEKLCHRDEHSWAKGYRLRDLIPRAEKIKEARAASIVETLRASQQNLFSWAETADELDVTSCGLLCGK